jgi:hypothetical protein
MSGVIATGPVGTKIFQLLAVKGALRLESLGMKHSKIRSLRKVWALEMGLKANAKYPEILAKIEEKLTELKNDPRGTGIEAL